MPSFVLPLRPSLEQLKNQAKSLLKTFQAADQGVAVRLKQSLPRLSGLAERDVFHAKISLKDTQHVIAREHGFGDWTALKRHVEETQSQKHSAGTAEIGFRAPTEDDIEAIQAGWDRGVPHDPLATNWAQTARDLVFPSYEEGLSRVAILNDSVIGFASAMGGALRALYVEGAYRRQGVGDRLLSDIIEFAQRKGWKQLSVATSHYWVGTMPGIDSRYDNALRFLEHRGFARRGFLPDVEADFQDIEAASRQRPLEGICAVSEYPPDAIEEMKAFDERVEPNWNWVEWIEKFPQTDPNRVRLVARAEGQLVGCIDIKISNGLAGLAKISVDGTCHQEIGSALLRAAASQCQQRGAASMFAGMAPRELFEANGWRVQREFVKMAKPLTV